MCIAPQVHCFHGTITPVTRCGESIFRQVGIMYLLGITHYQISYLLYTHTLPPVSTKWYPKAIADVSCLNPEKSPLNPRTHSIQAPEKKLGKPPIQFRCVLSIQHPHRYLLSIQYKPTLSIQHPHRYLLSIQHRPTLSIQCTWVLTAYPVPIYTLYPVSNRYFLSDYNSSLSIQHHSMLYIQSPIVVDTDFPPRSNAIDTSYLKQGVQETSSRLSDYYYTLKWGDILSGAEHNSSALRMVSKELHLQDALTCACW